MIPPRPTTTASGGRQPRYISYATQSINVVFTPTGGGSPTPFVQNLTPTSPGCQSNLNSSTICTLQLPGLTAGGYTAAFTTYDGTLNGSNVPTGNVLSANQSVPVTIVTGQANTISVTLDGVPVSVAVIPSASSTLSGSRAAGYTLSKCFGFQPAGVEGITVVGVDADQNYILGPGAPTPGLASSDTTMAGVTAPVSTAPNAFTLTRAATPATGLATFSLTASVTPLAGSGSTTPVTVNIPVTFDLTNCRVVTTIAGSTYGYQDGTGAGAHFGNPFGVAVDGSGTVYVADYSNNRIRKITTGGVVTTLAGSGNQGWSDGTGTAASFTTPSGVAVDGSGNVYVADNGNNLIRKITPGGVVTTLAGNLIQGIADGTGTAARFNVPMGVAVDAGGNVFVADFVYSLIRRITPGGVVTTLAGSSTGYADGAGTAASFAHPKGIAVDGSGTVYVADYSNNRIRKITGGGVVTTLAGSGAAGSADGTGTAAEFSSPSAVAVDAVGNVYVADSGNQLIRKITPGGVVTTLAGSTAGFSDGTGTAAQFFDPYGVAVDGSGNVYVADFSGNRIREIR